MKTSLVIGSNNFNMVRDKKPLQNKKDPKVFRSVLAGAEGIEPSSKVLETSVLPLNHAPTARVSGEWYYNPYKSWLQGAKGLIPSKDGLFWN